MNTAQWATEIRKDFEDLSLSPQQREFVVGYLMGVISKEREECAKIVEDHHRKWVDHFQPLSAQSICEEIRNR